MQCQRWRALMHIHDETRMVHTLGREKIIDATMDKTIS